MQKKHTPKIAAALALLVGAALYYLAQKPAGNGVGEPQLGAAAFHGIPPEGTGGDPALNRLKNRWSAPDSVRDISIGEIIRFPHELLDNAGRKDRSKWDNGARAQAANKESEGARVEGFLVAVKESGPESCNGHSDSLRDYHIWIAAGPEAQKRDAMIVEMTPFWKERFPEWRLRYLESLARRHSKVRVSGWILWDEEHPDEVGKSRLTQWEIHPVTDFEVFNNGSWQRLTGGGVAYLSNE